MRAFAGLLALAMLLGGCYSWTAIKPTELPKINGNPTVLPDRSGGHVQIVNVAQVETPDGRLAEIRGQSDARVQLKDTTLMSFEHPIRSSVENQSLTIMSGNHPKTTIPLDNIQSVEVSQGNRAEAAGVIVGILLPLALTIVFVSTVR
jgi:hypothetical protein